MGFLNCLVVMHMTFSYMFHTCLQFSHDQAAAAQQDFFVG